MECWISTDLIKLRQRELGTKRQWTRAPEGDREGNTPHLPGVVEPAGLPALEKSVPAVKADAARTCSRSNATRSFWAVLDSGSTATHERSSSGRMEEAQVARQEDVRFHQYSRDRQPRQCRYRATSAEASRSTRISRPASTGRRRERLKTIANDAKEKRPTNWDVVEELITLSRPPDAAQFPRHACRRHHRRERRSGRQTRKGCVRTSGSMTFACWDKRLEDTEFAIIAALQYIRYLNERHSYITIHGANLSLSIPHNVRNYACGRRRSASNANVWWTTGWWSSRRRATAVIRTSKPRKAFSKATLHSASPIRETAMASSRSARRMALAAHLWGQLLLEPRPDRRRPPEAGSRGARGAHPVDRS